MWGAAGKAQVAPAQGPSALAPSHAEPSHAEPAPESAPEQDGQASNASAVSASLGVEASSEQAPAQSVRVLTLREALALAREHQPALRMARADTDAARARASQSLAELLPQIVGTAQYQRTTANLQPRPSFVARATAERPPPSHHTVNFYTFGVNATQLLYDSQRSHSGYRAVKEEAEAQVARARAAERDVEFQVRNAFFEARAFQALVDVARENLRNQERHLAQAQAFVDVGTRPEIDLAQVRTDVANAKVQLIRAENAYQVGKARLNQAMGVEKFEDYVLAADTLPPVPEEEYAVEDVYRAALLHRPELAALERRARAARLFTRAAKGLYGPSVSLTGNYSNIGIELGDLVWNWNVGVLATWNFLQGGAARAATREAEANARSVYAEQDALRQAVRFEIEEARLEVRAAKAVLEAAEEARRNARERLKLAEGRYAAGVGNVIELGDAQYALTDAEAQAVQAEFELAAARARFLRALGKGE